MSSEHGAAWSTEGVRELALAVLRHLGVEEVEMEVSEIYLEPLVELAEGGEVMPIDTGDPAGGFGGADLWIATVVPALAAAMGLRRNGTLTLPALKAAIADVIRRVGSPRAKQNQTALARALRTAIKVDVSE